LQWCNKLIDVGGKSNKETKTQRDKETKSVVSVENLNKCTWQIF
jgi:hypothetical protein